MFQVVKSKNWSVSYPTIITASVLVSHVFWFSLGDGDNVVGVGNAWSVSVNKRSRPGRARSDGNGGGGGRDAERVVAANVPMRRLLFHVAENDQDD